MTNKSWGKFNKNGVLTLVYIGLSLLVLFFTRGSDQFIFLLAMLFFMGMAMRYVVRYIHDIHDTPESRRNHF